MFMLAFALVGHLVGDYLLQNDWQDTGKKQSSLICGFHCLLWTASVLAFAGSTWWVWWVPLVLFITHFAQDRGGFVLWYMNHVGQGERFAKPPLAPWSFIVVDNTMHMVVLALVAQHIG